MRKQNSYCLKEKLHSELYAEIDRMEPVFRHLLEAQLRGKAKEGMSYLRQSVSPSTVTRTKTCCPTSSWYAFRHFNLRLSRL